VYLACYACRALAVLYHLFRMALLHADGQDISLGTWFATRLSGGRTHALRGGMTYYLTRARNWRRLLCCLPCTLDNSTVSLCYLQGMVLEVMGEMGGRETNDLPHMREQLSLLVAAAWN